MHCWVAFVSDTTAKIVPPAAAGDAWREMAPTASATAPKTRTTFRFMLTSWSSPQRNARSIFPSPRRCRTVHAALTESHGAEGRTDVDVLRAVVHVREGVDRANCHARRRQRKVRDRQGRASGGRASSVLSRGLGDVRDARRTRPRA